MRQIPVDTQSATVMVAQPPQKKIANRQTGEAVVDRETGATMMIVDLLFVMEGNAEVVQVSAPEPAFTGDLMMGTPVGVTGLVARPWEREFNGEKRHGISYRAVAITALNVAASSGKG